MIPPEQLERLERLDREEARVSRAADEAAARVVVMRAREALREAERAAALVRRRVALASWLQARERAELIATLAEEEARDAHRHVINATLADDLLRECREAAMAVAITLAGIVLCALAALTAPIFWAPGIILVGVLAWLGGRCYTVRRELREIERDLAASERRLIESGAQSRLARRVVPASSDRGTLDAELQAAESALREAGEPIPIGTAEARACLAALPPGDDDERALREALGQIERRRGHLEAALARLAASRRER
jgi:hypothetical protein